MTKEKRILFYVTAWLLLGIIVCFIGLSNVSAATYYLDYSYSQRYFDNRGSSVTAVTTTWVESLQSYVSDDITTAAGSYGAGLSITSPIPILENHTYTLSIYFEEINNIALSSKNYLAFSSTLQGAANNYANGEYDNEIITSNVSNNTILNFSFTSRRNGSYIFIPWTTTSTVTQSYVTTQIIMEDLGSEGVSIDEINTSLTNQTNEINSSIQNSTNTITDSITETEDNINSNIDDMESAIVDSNKETQEVIKDQFNSCRDSYNLFDKNATYIKRSNSTSVSINDNDVIVINSNTSGNGGIAYFIDIGNNEQITISFDEILSTIDNANNTRIQYDFYDEPLTELTSTALGTYIPKNVGYATVTSTARYLMLLLRVDNGSTGTFKNIMVSKGSIVRDYEPYGEEICSNKIDETNDTLKGGFSSIGNWFTELGNKIGNFFDNLLTGILDGLKSLFIPEDGYFELWFNDLKMFFEDKLGFLATPFTIIIDFVNRYLDLNPTEDIIINIPDITVPNFEDHIIVKATTFNWSQLLKSKDSLNTLWQLYLSFIDVFLILNFINLCENKYNRIFGGDTTQYEYYTVEDSYNVDVNTGEVKNMRRNERKTTRKKVN